jgi:hypothetical protein
MQARSSTLFFPEIATSVIAGIHFLCFLPESLLSEVERFGLCGWR